MRRQFRPCEDVQSNSRPAGEAVRLALLLFALRLFAADPDPLVYGNPGGDCNLIDKQYFVICYSTQWKTPLWVGFRLTRELLQGETERSNRFYPEPLLPKADRSELKDYAKSGYDRGHMAPASSFKRSKQAMQATFSLANMVPQTPELNRVIWRMLEDCVRTMASDAKHGNLYVFVGPLNVSPDRKPLEWLKGEGRVAVPSHTWQVIFCDHERDEDDEFFAFVTPNLRKFPANASPADFYFSVHTVEDLTGLRFFSTLGSEYAAREAESRPLPPEGLKWRPANQWRSK
jgi:endonuclease G